MFRSKAAAIIKVERYQDAVPKAPPDIWNASGRFRREWLAGMVHSLVPFDDCGFYRRWVIAPDRSYIIDRAPADPRIIVAFGGAVNRFHDSIAVAEHVAALVTGTEAVRTRYALTRPALQAT